MDETDMSCTAFEGCRRIASGELKQVVSKAKEVLDSGEGGVVLIFDDSNSELIEIDFRGTLDEVIGRLEKPAAESGASPAANTDQNALRGPGRPRLGVVSREVTLLPRHWEWLGRQPGGASVALRKLVEEARRVHSGRDKVRHSQEAAYRFMSAMAGDMPGFEEAARALFAGNRERFDTFVASWPADVRDYAEKLASVALGGRPGDTVDISNKPKGGNNACPCQ
jgi:hypothetical protein